MAHRDVLKHENYDDCQTTWEETMELCRIFAVNWDKTAERTKLLVFGTEATLSWHCIIR